MLSCSILGGLKKKKFVQEVHKWVKMLSHVSTFAGLFLFNLRKVSLLCPILCISEVLWPALNTMCLIWFLCGSLAFYFIARSLKFCHVPSFPLQNLSNSFVRSCCFCQSQNPPLWFNDIHPLKVCPACPLFKFDAMSLVSSCYLFRILLFVALIHIQYFRLKDTCLSV